jgi:hypothetical protein
MNRSPGPSPPGIRKGSERWRLPPTAGGWLLAEMMVSWLFRRWRKDLRRSCVMIAKARSSARHFRPTARPWRPGKTTPPAYCGMWRLGRNAPPLRDTRIRYCVSLSPPTALRLQPEVGNPAFDSGTLRQVNPRQICAVTSARFAVSVSARTDGPWLLGAPTDWSSSGTRAKANAAYRSARTPAEPISGVLSFRPTD